MKRDSGTRALQPCLGILGLALLGSATPAAASGFSFAGELRDGTVPFEGSADFELALYDRAEGGSALWSETQGGVLVVGGVFALDVGSVTDIPPAVAQTLGLFLEIVVEGDALAPRVVLGQVPVAERAQVAGFVNDADDALTLGGFGADELATTAALQTLGQASVAWGNLSGLPSGVADGDTGTPFTPGSGIALTSGQLSLANDGVQASHLAAGAVGSVDLAVASVGNTQLADASVASADVEDGSIGSADFADATVTEAKLAGTASLYRVQYAGCAQEVGALLTTANCTVGGSCSLPFAWDCENATCGSPRSGSCANVFVGKLPTQ